MPSWVTVKEKIDFVINLSFQIEIDDPKEITPEFLYDEVHPKKNIAKQQFAKPPAPRGRGPKRMTKPSGDEN